MSKNKNNDILYENIAFCSERIDLSQKQYRLCVTALAESLCNNSDTDIDGIYKSFKDIMPNADGCAYAILFKHISDMYPHLYKCDAITSLLGMNEITQAGSHGRISFVRNRYNDMVYEKFSQIIRNTKFSYVTSFAQACEDVVNGNSEYSILPVENSSDGRLFGFYSLLDRYDLRICGVTELDTDDDTASDIRFALVGKTLPRRIQNDSVCDFEFSIVREDEKKLIDLLSAASEFSSVPRKIDTLPLGYDHDLYRFYFTFRMPCSEAYALALYLSYEYPNYTPIGFYPIQQ